MKAIMTLKAIGRTDKGSVIRLIDDNTGEIQPQKNRLVAAESESGRLRIVDNENKREVCDIVGELARTTTWKADPDNPGGPKTATAAWTFRMQGPIKASEVAALWGANALAVEFKPAQKTMIDNEPQRLQKTA